MAAEDVRRSVQVAGEVAEGCPDECDIAVERDRPPAEALGKEKIRCEECLLRDPL